MNIYTLNVGQGQFVIVTGSSHAFIVDTYVPLNPKHDIINVKSALATILNGKYLVGLLVTGFDADHFNEVGLKIVLNKYRPEWIMYPKYFKLTSNAETCFSIIKSFDPNGAFRRISISLSDDTRRFFTNLSKEFSFEIFSPHKSDMNSSNNCSLVCKVKELSTGDTYLITGDTENDRWDSIVRYFGSSISATVLSAPHHGSKNGISQDAIALIKPHTALISAGVDNQYGHPDREAMSLFLRYASEVYSTNQGYGQSLITSTSPRGVLTHRLSP